MNNQITSLNQDQYSKPKILIIDDEPSEVGAIIEFLDAHDFEPMIATDGKDGIETAHLALPDIILLDIGLPGMDGFETCRQLKDDKITRDIPVIFLTGRTETDIKVKGFKVGGVDYIEKPFQAEEVLVRVETHLTIRNLHHQLQEQNAQLEEQKSRYQTLFDSTFEGIVVCDNELVKEVNQPIEEMFGYTRDELVNKKHFQDFLTQESYNLVAEHIHANDGQPYEVQGKHKNEKPFPIQIQEKACPYDGPKVRIAAIRDLSPLEALEEIVILENARFGKIIGESTAMRELYREILNASRTKHPVLICGERGTGKELVAKEIHERSKREKFFPVNCGAVPETLFEREFFGHRKGVFSGADRDLPGYLGAANGGTLFLDEVTEIPYDKQTVLLRFLQEGEYMPVGETRSQEVDVRIIAATNRDLKEAQEQGKLRKDFLDRIQVIQIDVPPLREHKADIPLLIEHFRQEEEKETNKPQKIPASVIKTLCARFSRSKENVRELQSVVRNYLARKRLDFPEDSQVESLEGDGVADIMNLIQEQGMSYNEAVNDLEKRCLTAALEQNGWKIHKTADMLKIKKKAFYNKRKAFGIEVHPE